jgi:hypothetical protein
VTSKNRAKLGPFSPPWQSQVVTFVNVPLLGCQHGTNIRPANALRALPARDMKRRFQVAVANLQHFLPNPAILVQYSKSMQDSTSPGLCAYGL